MLQLVLYIILIFIAFLSSLRSLRLDIPHYKVICLVLAVDFVVEIVAIVLWKFNRINMPLYNFNSLLEFWLYAYYYSLIIYNGMVRKMIRIYLWVLPVAWIILVILIFHPDKWNSPFYVLGSVPTVLLSALYYHQLFTAERLVKLSASFEFWVATALIIYFACNLPYLGMLNFLNTNFRELAGKLLVLTHILNYILYAILLYAYICTTPIEKCS